MVADVIASGRWKSHKVNYFNFSSEVLNRTSSHTCGRWYLPTFLLRDGSLTLMYRASFIVLIWFKSSLPTILKLLMVTLWPLMLLWSYMGEVGFRCSLNLSPKILEFSPIYSSSQSTPVTLISVDDSTSLLDWISVLGSHQEVLDGGASFAIHLYPKLSANVLNALTESTIAWYHYIRLLLGVVVSVSWSLFIFWIVCFLLNSVESPCGVLAVLQCIL